MIKHPVAPRHRRGGHTMQATAKEAFYITCITLLLFFTCAVSWAGGIPQTLAERVARVFPFQVEQQYEFKSAADFTTVEGDVLPAGTVATITIEDTVFNDTTYLHIPYWANLGTGYYRLDEDSTKIWNRHPGTGEEAVFLYIGFTGITQSLSFFITAAQDYVLVRKYFPETDSLTNWAGMHWCYRDVYPVSEALAANAPREMGWIENISIYTTGITESVVFGYSFLRLIPGSYTLIHALYGADISGVSYHFIDQDIKLCGYFRPVSSEPWPEMYGHITDVNRSDKHPDALILSAYPNPFNPSTTITYSLPEAAHVRLYVININGQLVRTLVNAPCETGNHQIIWDGADDNSQLVTSGVYLCRLITGETSKTLRILLVR